MIKIAKRIIQIFRKKETEKTAEILVPENKNEIPPYELYLGEDLRAEIKSKSLKNIEDEWKSSGKLSYYLHTALRKMEISFRSKNEDPDMFQFNTELTNPNAQRIIDFITKYFGYTVDKFYLLTHPKLPENGILVNISRSGFGGNELQRHLWVYGRCNGIEDIFPRPYGNNVFIVVY